MDDWIKDLENAMDVVFPVVSEYNKNINYPNSIERRLTHETNPYQ